MEINSMYFSKEQVEAGEMKDFLDVLLKQCYGASNYYNDIHIKPEDCGAFIIEWINVPWDHSFGGSFQHVEEDQLIMIDKRFPDGHYELCFNDVDFEERLEMFLKENPGWVKTSYGTWTNEIENERMRKEFEETSDSTGHDWVINDVEDDKSDSNDSEVHYENGIPQ